MDKNTPVNVYVPYTVTSIHNHIQIHIEIHWVYRFMYLLVSVIWIDGEGRMSKDGNGLRKTFWRLGRNESQVKIHQRHKKVIMGLWEWHLQLWKKKKVLQSSARKDRRLRLGCWQWYLSSKGTMQLGGFEPDRKLHHSLAEPRLGPGVNRLWEVLKENRILDGEREKMGEKSPGCWRETDLIPVSYIAQMANPYTCCCFLASLHDSNRILTQPTDISYPALTYFQTCALIMSAASQSFLVITPSPSAIPTPEKHSHTHLI